MSCQLHLQMTTESPTSQRQVIIEPKAKGTISIKLACRQDLPLGKAAQNQENAVRGSDTCARGAGVGAK